MPDNNKRMGKYVSMLLRHHPEEAGVILDEHGCVVGIFWLLSGRNSDRIRVKQSQER